MLPCWLYLVLLTPAFTIILFTTTRIRYCLALPGTHPQHPNHHFHRSKDGSKRNTSSSKTRSHVKKENKKKQKQKQKEECYYKTLGVSKEDIIQDKNAQETLKKAYRRASLRHHPDKPGGNEETFKRLNRAYEVLSDPDKRRLYDQYGHDAGLDPSTAAGAAGAGMGNHQNPFGFSPHQGSNTPFTQHYYSSSSSQSMDPNDIFRQFTSSSSSTSTRRNNHMFGGNSGLGGGGSGSFGSSGGFAGLDDLLAQMMMGSGSSSDIGNGGSFAKNRQSHQHGGRRREQQRQQQQQPIKNYTRDLPCTLPELYLGTTKKVKVTFPPNTPPLGGGGGAGGGGGSHVYTIQLVKGWKAGTKITFPPSAKFPNVRMTFVITETASSNNETNFLSSLLQRRGNDLIFRHQLDPHKRNKDEKFVPIEVPLLPDGTQVWKRSIPATSSLLRPGQTLTVPDLGMPIKGGPERGNLIIEFY
jgi:DnaJ homolog subfamily B member 4